MRKALLLALTISTTLMSGSDAIAMQTPDSEGTASPYNRVPISGGSSVSGLSHGTAEDVAPAFAGLSPASSVGTNASDVSDFDAAAAFHNAFAAIMAAGQNADAEQDPMDDDEDMGGSGA